MYINFSSIKKLLLSIYNRPNLLFQGLIS
jgi:hypothetical protein